MNEPSPRTSPLVAGAILLGAGLLLRRWRPGALTLPERPERHVGDSGAQRAARKTRDGIARVLPKNLTGSVGRSLVIMGVGLVLVRLLDMAVDEGEELF